MIEKMTHYTFLVYYKDYAPLLEKLQQWGVLHVTPTGEGNPAEHSDFQAALRQSERWAKVLREMRSVLKADDLDGLSATATDTDVATICAQWDDLAGQIAAERHTLAELDEEIKVMTPWGSFGMESLDGLTRAGWNTRFWTVPARKMDASWVKTYNAFIVGSDKHVTRFVTITPAAQDVVLPAATEVHISPSPVSTLIMLQTKAKDALAGLVLKQGDYALAHYREVEAAYLSSRDAIDLRKVELTTAGEADGRVMILEGWIPTASTERINALLDDDGVYYQTRPATPDDKAPVKLKNNRVTRLFEVITKLYDMPTYGEWDLTPLFAPMFVLFFGLCLGDAGYGLILLIAGLILYFKKPALRSIATLVCILGGGTLVFGTICGNLFGIPLIKETLTDGTHVMQWAWLDNFKAGILDSNQLFYASLLIGVFQIMVGMVTKAIRYTVRYGFAYALSTWGWLSVFLGCGGAYVLSMYGFVGDTTARWCYYIFGGFGILAIFLLNDVEALRRKPLVSPLVNIGAGLWGTYNMASGLLGDVLSYVRLFALSISGSVLGLVFNDLAMQAKDGVPILGWILAFVILIFGHGINLFMSGLSAFVHPMRLTFVEFYKNAGFEGGGKAYDPLIRHAAQS